MAKSPAKKQLVERVRQLGPHGVRATSAFLDALVEIEAPLSAHQEEALPGLPEVPTGQLRAAAARNEARVWAARTALYERGLTREQAAARAGVKPNQITNLLRDGELIAIDGPEGLRLPAWQFDPEAKRGRLEGLARVSAAFPGRVLGLSSWMSAVNPSLGGRTPRQALLDGDVDLVVAVASGVGA
jgi:hypothetical protein